MSRICYQRKSAFLLWQLDLCIFAFAFPFHFFTRSMCLCCQCSVTCGQGKTTRQVLCVNFSDQEVNASECDPDDRPATEQDCAMSQCPSRSSDSRPPSSPNTSTRNLPRSQSHQWRTGPWGAVRLPKHNALHHAGQQTSGVWYLRCCINLVRPITSIK